MVAGVDSSTQSCKYVTVDSATGVVLSSSALPHPEGTAPDPKQWWDALDGVGAIALRGVQAVSVVAQQHSTIMLGDDGEPVMNALLWNDRRANEDAVHLRSEFGVRRWATEIGSVPTAAHPVSKLRWLARTDPETAERVRTVLVPHDWLTWKLLERPVDITTDRSDASGTGYWSARTEMYRTDLVEMAFGRSIQSPHVIGPAKRAGVTSHGVVVGAGSGDNAAAVFGLSTAPGEAVISIGTSMTASVVTSQHVIDETGQVSDMADASGLQLPIVATNNGARTIGAAARMLRVSVSEFDELATAAPPDASGLSFLPYLDGERTPQLAEARGVLAGIGLTSMTPENVARAVVLGLGCAIVDAIDDLVRAGVVVSSVVLIGGGAKSASLRQAIADLLRHEIVWPEPREYAALGAARQAAWALTGELPMWPAAPRVVVKPAETTDWVDGVRTRHRMTAELSLQRDR